MTSRRRPMGVVQSRLFLRFFVHTQKEGPFFLVLFLRLCALFFTPIFSHYYFSPTKSQRQKKKKKETEKKRGGGGGGHMDHLLLCLKKRSFLKTTFFSTFLFLLFKTQLHPEHRLGRTSLSY